MLAGVEQETTFDFFGFGTVAPVAVVNENWADFGFEKFETGRIVGLCRDAGRRTPANEQKGNQSDLPQRFQSETIALIWRKTKAYSYSEVFLSLGLIETGGLKAAQN